MTKLPRVALSAADVDRLLAVCGRGQTGHRNRALLLLLHRSGLRISEALDLLPSDIEGDQVHVRHGKGDHSRSATIDGLPTFAPLLNLWLDVRKSRGLNGKHPIFCTLQGGWVDSSYVRAMVARLRKRAGIEKRVHLHGFRHGHAQAMLEAAMPLNALSAQLGHKHVSSTDHYIRGSEAAARRFIRARG